LNRGGVYLLITGALLLFLSILFTLKLFLSDKSDNYEPDFQKYPFATSKQDVNGTDWFGSLRKKERLTNHYPVEEIGMEWTLVDPSEKKERLYKLSFEKMNGYQYFCLKQVLDHHRLKRSVHRINDHYNLYVSLYSLAAANALMKELAQYDLYGEMTPYETDIQY